MVEPAGPGQSRQVGEIGCADTAVLGDLIYLHKRLAARGHKVRVVGARDELIRFSEDFHLAELFIEEKPTAA